MVYDFNRMCKNQRPIFRLEPLKRAVCKREPNIFFTKTEYQPGVRVTDWEKQLESRPIDNDPYCPGSLNYFLSHYKRSGNDPDKPWTTSTGSALEQLFLKYQLDEMNHNTRRYMVNYFTYKDTLACEMDLIDRTCPTLCAETYLSTMQKSYRPPYPYPMHRFSFPTIPFLQNRRFRWTQDPALSKYMFFDEGYIEEVKQIQKIKGFRTKSYEPSLAMNTDGTLPPERIQKCFELGF